VFDELSAADEALALGTSELPAGADALASRMTARHARDKDDLLVLLDALGLPTDSDATTPLLAFIPTPDPAADAADPDPSGDQSAMPHSPAPATDALAVTAFEAVAVSMHRSGYPTAAITEATGLTEEEITTAVAPADTAAPDLEPAVSEPETHVPAPAGDTVSEDADVEVDVLLSWADKHPLASVRARAGRIRQDLADLTQRRTTEAATAEVEARIAKMRADLKAEEERLRRLKAGGSRAGSRPAAPAPQQRSRW
jgi:hypothetical protein